ncbi:MAG: DUF3488 domain-containing protein [Opitutae bacterium]|nr:DUF3488 domain-containing protein [Opitutae bacterium]
MRRLKWLLGGALALVSLGTVFFLDVEALGLVGVAGAVILAALVWPRLPSRVPALVWKLAVPAIILAAAADFYFNPETLPVLIRLAILLVLYRATAYRGKREDLQLIVLGLFLVVVAGVLTVSLGFAFLLLLFTACALGFLFVITLIGAAEPGGVAALPTAGEAPAWARLGWAKVFARLRLVADWRLLGFAAALFAGVVGVSALLFLVIPRFEIASGFFLGKYITRKSRTGFTETLKFGDVSELIKDDSVALRADLSDATPLPEVPYWRLVVLDEYSPQGFKISTGLKNEMLRTQRTVQAVRGRSGGRRITDVGGVWTIYVEPGVSRFLPLPGDFGLLRLREMQPVQTSPALRLAALRVEPLTMTAYQLDGVELSPTLADARTARLLAQDAVAPGRDERTADPRLSLRGPPGAVNRAVIGRALEEITHGKKLAAAEFAARATAWLQAKHAYALSVRLPPGDGDDIVRWLDSNEPGFCEYFAAGLTVLARAAGHPARVVAGFHGGTRNAFENYYMVKNSDAHAWVEIYDGRGAWLRADPTPGNGARPGADAARAAQQTQDSSWSARFDSLRVIWYRRIVNFDSRQQVEMLDQVKTFTTDSGTRLREVLEAFGMKLKAWAMAPWDKARMVRTGSELIIGVATLWVLVVGAFRFRGRWRAWRAPEKIDPVRREAGEHLARLREVNAGGERQEARGRAASDERRVTSEAHGGVVAELQRLRYGRRETWPEPRAVFRRAKRARSLARK